MDNKCLKEGFARLTIVLWVVVFGFASAALANEFQENENPQQSRTGPKPPREVLEHDALKPQVRYMDILSQVTLPVPAYNWRHGCGPTVVGMVVGYYDTLGYSDLIPGSAGSQSSAVNQAIASGGDSASPYPPGSERHYEDCARPEDSVPNLLTDDHLTQGRTAHNNDCIADHMDTSKSTRSNYYGWSWSSDIGPAFVNYVNQRNTTYGPSFQQYRMASGDLTWSVLTGEIDAGRPMVFLVDRDGNNETDHFVTVIGYRTSPANQYGCWDTWSTSNIRWENFAAMSNGVLWGIWGGWRLKLAPPTGSLQVTISPQGAIDAGAQWRVDGGSWHDSGYTQGGLSVGSHTIEFKTISGWNKPSDKTVQISAGQITYESGTYASILYGGGSGTEEGPFQISTVSHWQNLMNTPGDWDKHFILTADIDLDGVLLSPIGNDPNNFTGVLYGNHHIIRNADINTPDCDYVGLFGYVGPNGAILNLGIEDVTIVGDDYVGGLVGRNEAGGPPPVGSCLLLGLNKCYSTGSVSGNSYVGGLVGDNYGDLHMCYAAVSVTGNTKIGGLVGGTNQENIGGLDLGNMHECYSTGSVSGNSYVGGLLGDNYGLIDTCYATGSVTGNARVGGLVGGNGKADFPGPRGEARGYIHGCYSTGSVSGSSHVGGLVGYHEVGTVSHSFWDIETSEQLTSQGGVAKTTDQMKTLSTFTSASWTFVGEKANSSSGFWRMCADGVHYPRLNWEFRQYADFICPDGVGLEDFGYFAGPWRMIGPCDSPANLDGDQTVGFGDLMIFCQQWLTGR